MRVSQIRFKNLNSLVGEWKIDLENPAYDYDGIFAITGPTGAGKTTILDAICLALYGRTPRLNKVSKSNNEIMSRQTGECFAEVTFQTQVGRFRCHWSQYRARKKYDEVLQTPKHEIADTDTGKIIATKLRDVAEQVERVTGLNFDRFTRSILLAQGNFTAFLQASPDQRAPILEQLTGTEIYSRVSKYVHERQREERQKVELQQAEKTAVIVLSNQQEEELSQVLNYQQVQEQKLRKEKIKNETAIVWLETVKNLESEINNVNIKRDSIAKEKANFRAKQGKLDKALKAAEIEGLFATLLGHRGEQNKDCESIQKNKKQQVGLKTSLLQTQQDLAKTEREKNKVEKGSELEFDLIKKTRHLDSKITENERILATIMCSYQEIAKQLLDCKRERQIALDGQKNIMLRLKCSETYMATNSEDKTLVLDLSGITQQIENLKKISADIQSINHEISEQSKLLKVAQFDWSQQKKFYKVCKKENADAIQNVGDTENKLQVILKGRQLSEYRFDYEELMQKRAYLNTIINLEAERAKLIEGKACPLCGAKEHPFCQGYTVSFNQADQEIKKLSQLVHATALLEEKLDSLEDIKKNKKFELVQAKQNRLNNIQKIKKIHIDIKHFQSRLEKETNYFCALKEKVLLKLHPFGVSKLDEFHFGDDLKVLNHRVEKWQENQTNKKIFIEQQNTIESKLGRIEGVIEVINKSLGEKETEQNKAVEYLGVLSDHRKNMYGIKNPDDEENRWKNRVENCVQQAKWAKDKCDAAKQKLDAINKDITSLQNRMAERLPKLEESEDSFKQSLNKAGFSSEQLFIACQLSSEERYRLSMEKKNIDENEVVILSHKKNLEKKLVNEKNKKISNITLQSLQGEKDRIENSTKNIREELGATKQKFDDNAVAKKRLRDQDKLIEVQRKEFARWNLLHSLIGSADGKKYRNFAQGLTFEIMIGHANRQLDKMTDRYLLIRNQCQPLELNVVDNYQAGKIRSIKNLSGGENFIVSLALALGLSKMASQNVRVDSIFMDEGFGSLDEEMLSTMLEALSGLQYDGKMIGVISHVTAIRERIGTQIQIRPQAGGRSIISGPGCSKVAK